MNKSREQLLAEGFVAFKLFLELQYRALAAEPAAKTLNLEAMRNDWETACWEIFIQTHCKSVLHWASRMHIFTFEKLLETQNELHQQLCESFPELKLSEAQWHALDVYFKVAAMEPERLTLLACLWLF